MLKIPSPLPLAFLARDTDKTTPLFARVLEPQSPFTPCWCNLCGKGKTQLSPPEFLYYTYLPGAEQPDFTCSRCLSAGGDLDLVYLGEVIHPFLDIKNFTEERAKKVIEAFGPCSSVYECTTPKELVFDAMDYTRSHGDRPARDLNAWLSFQLSMEGERLVRERQFDEEPTRLKAKAEAVQMVTGIYERLTKLGYEIAKPYDMRNPQ